MARSKEGPEQSPRYCPRLRSASRSRCRCGSRAESTSSAITQVDPTTLTCTDLINFDEVPGSGGVGTNVDGVLISGAESFAEWFVGQTLSFGNSSTGRQVGDFDVLSGTASGPLALQVGAAGHNLSVLFNSGSNVLTGIRSLAFPAFNRVGEGAIAGLFDARQFELGFTTVGAGGGRALRDGEFFRAGRLADRHRSNCSLIASSW